MAHYIIHIMLSIIVFSIIASPIGEAILKRRGAVVDYMGYIMILKGSRLLYDLYYGCLVVYILL